MMLMMSVVEYKYDYIYIDEFHLCLNNTSYHSEVSLKSASLYFGLFFAEYCVTKKRQILFILLKLVLYSV